MPLEREDIGLIAQEIAAPIVAELEKQTAMLEILVRSHMANPNDDLDVPAFLERIKRARCPYQKQHAGACDCDDDCKGCGRANIDCNCGDEEE